MAGQGPKRPFSFLRVNGVGRRGAAPQKTLRALPRGGDIKPALSLSLSLGGVRGALGWVPGGHAGGSGPGAGAPPALTFFTVPLRASPGAWGRTVGSPRARRRPQSRSGPRGAQGGREALTKESRGRGGSVAGVGGGRAGARCPHRLLPPRLGPRGGVGASLPRGDGRPSFQEEETSGRRLGGPWERPPFFFLRAPNR